MKAFLGENGSRGDESYFRGGRWNTPWIGFAGSRRKRGGEMVGELDRVGDGMTDG